MKTPIQQEGLAEFIGTFMLILVGAGAVAAIPGNVVVGALSHGMILVAIILQYGHISGAHVNPGVTIAFFTTGQINGRKASVYIIAQFAGALAASLLLRFLFADLAIGNDTIGQTVPAEGLSLPSVIIVEFVLTFFLVSSVYHAAVFKDWAGLTPLVIAFTLMGCIMFGGPLTGASLNPARTFGPAFFAEDTQDIVEVVSYFVGILGGAVAAGFVQSTLFANNERGLEYEQE